MALHFGRGEKNCRIFAETTLNSLLVTHPLGTYSGANNFHLLYPSLSAAHFAAVSGILPVYADMLGIHGAGDFKIRNSKGWDAWVEANREMPSVS